MTMVPSRQTELTLDPLPPVKSSPAGCKASNAMLPTLRPSLQSRSGEEDSLEQWTDRPDFLSRGGAPHGLKNCQSQQDLIPASRGCFQSCGRDEADLGGEGHTRGRGDTPGVSSKDLCQCNRSDPPNERLFLCEWCGRMGEWEP